MKRTFHAYPDPSFGARARPRVQIVDPGPVRRRPRRLGLNRLDQLIAWSFMFLAAVYFTAHALLAAGVGCGS